MRVAVVLLLFAVSQTLFSAADAEFFSWAWMSGSNLIDQMGAYGDFRSESPGNASIVPSARQGSAYWLDSSRGELWLFGGATGSSTATAYNDLWRYRIASNSWTWMAGSNTTGSAGIYGTRGAGTSSTTPGSRIQPAFWMDSQRREMWLFGGISGADALNDLWKYSIDNNTWTWVGGNSSGSQLGVYGTLGQASNTTFPGARWLSTSWIDATGRLCLFGGVFLNVSYMYFDDIWCYSANDSTWTWVGGSNSTDNSAVYGQLGVPGVQNTPGGRLAAASWFDTINNRLWLYGGGIFRGVVRSATTLGDLWRYDMTPGSWTWMGGQSTTNGLPQYGVQGVSSTDHFPGSRVSSVTWFDESRGDLWLFGGYIYNITASLDDLWRYNLQYQNWTWMGGNRLPDQPGNYGTSGIPSPSNSPSSRIPAALWYVSSSDEVWMFGGTQFVNGTTHRHYNDLWMGFRLRSNGENSTSGSKCISSILSNSSHCCATLCGYCNDCSTGMCTFRVVCPQPSPTSCGTPPAGATNVTCVDGKLSYNLPTSSVVGPVAIVPNVNIRLDGNGTIANASITVQVTGTFQSGLVIVTDCLELAGGQIIVNIDSSLFSNTLNGKELEILRLERPECFVDGLNSTVVVNPPPGGQTCRTVTASKQFRENSGGYRSLVVVFLVTESGCAGVPSDSGGVNVGVVAGSVVGVIIAVSAVIALVVWWKYSRQRQEAKQNAADHFIPPEEM
eukprot:TRINITY_DN4048_c0_g1_i1.p1 TRINITY_DN4048_c0_g1~~TRINITY_DN4048_c0_g1_i1.p1  ORF type:complete len:727 (-),score=60.52 TRINITY_DN4048_c0_g1_i1:7-2187(-)